MRTKIHFLFASFLLTVLILTVSCTEGDDFNYDKKAILITDTETDPLVKFVVEDTPSSYALTAKATDKVAKDVMVTFAQDTTLVATYNKEHNTNFYAAPVGSVTIENPEVTIESGTASSTIASVKVVSTENFKDGRTYVIPVTIKNVLNADGMEVLNSSKTIYLKISRVLKFTALDISNTNLYSNFIWDDAKAVKLTNFTFEIKMYAYNLHSISRLCAFEEKDEKNASMLRFGENGQDVNSLQWVSPKGGIISSTRFNTNQWYTISLTYDGSALTMYVNGIKDAALSASGVAVNFQRFELGMSWTGYRSSQYFNGRISEVRVWNRALSSSELQNALCGVDPQSNGLVAYWKLNEGSGHIFTDATGNGYDMDWSNTWREESEGAGLVNRDYSSAVKWVTDDKNKCNQ